MTEAKAQDGEAEMLVPGNKRRIQRRRAPRRELFGKRAKEDFLDALATNCNVAASAEIAGVSVGTVYRHRRIDPVFRDGWWQAMEQGAAKLVALRLQLEIERAEGGRNGLHAEMDGPPDARQIADLYRLMGALREHARGLSGASKAGRPQAAPAIDGVSEKLAAKLRNLGVAPGPAEADAEMGTATSNCPLGG